MLSKKDWQDIDKEFESYRSFCRQKQKDKDEARAEIERLEKEVERLTILLMKQDTARERNGWNDAIEAAKDAAYEWASDNAHKRNKYVDLLYAIRALRKD